ncbi:MAG: hypothetical protein JXB50_13300 [Spirochaetes bacterium]|nr:hypothetical protein [Spirochaetota bacterium]
MKIYSNEFKEEEVQKHLIPEGKSVAVLSREIGVSEQSVRNWIYKYYYVIIKNNGSELNILKYSDIENMDLILESKSKLEKQIGLWLREKRLKTERLKLWEDQMKEKINNKQDALKEENIKLKEDVKNLHNEFN